VQWPGGSTRAIHGRNRFSARSNASLVDHGLGAAGSEYVMEPVGREDDEGDEEYAS
jgi:hypothetical protein